jgi:hypothetical protein
VADHADRLGLLEERAREGDGAFVHAQEVGVRDPTRQHQAGVVRGVGLVHGVVDGEGVGLVEVVEGLDLARLGRDQLGAAARLLDRLPGLGELHLLDALGGDEECDALAVQLAHVDLLSLGLRLSSPQSLRVKRPWVGR